MAELSLNNVNKQYQGFHAVRGITLHIPDRSFVVLVGPSGCGKSTTLRMIAGLEEISTGEIRIGNKVVNDVAPGERDIAMVFQNYALYPHKTIRENIAFGLKQRRMPKKEIDRRIEEISQILSIEPLLSRKPRALSGGQRQRVAMGRAMVRNPEVFLFDEPLSNLDAKLRVQMRTEIKRLHQIIPTTTVYVTHDQIEAMTLADIVVVMNGGLIEQSGPPQTLYHQPVSRFVAGFIGSPAMNFFTATLLEESGKLKLCLTDGTMWNVPEARYGTLQHRINQTLTLGIRPEHFTLTPEGDEQNKMTVSLDVIEPLGQETLVYFIFENENYCVRMDPSFSGQPQESLYLYPKMEHIHLFDAQNGKRIPA